VEVVIRCAILLSPYMEGVDLCETHCGSLLMWGGQDASQLGCKTVKGLYCFGESLQLPVIERLQPLISISFLLSL